MIFPLGDVGAQLPNLAFEQLDVLLFSAAGSERRDQRICFKRMGHSVSRWPTGTVGFKKPDFCLLNQLLHHLESPYCSRALGYEMTFF